MAAPVTNNLDLATVNGMMNLCEAKEQARLTEAAVIAEPEQRREAYARRLREFYTREGVPISEETIQKSVAEYLENEMTFQEPRGGLAGFFAALFVYRLWVSLLLMFVMFVTVVAGLVAFLILDQNRRQAFTAATAITTAIENDLETTREAVANGEQTQSLDTQNRSEQLASKALPELLRNPQTELDQEIAKNFTAAEHALTLANEEATGYRQELAGTKNYHSKSTAGWDLLNRDATTAQDKLAAQLTAARNALTAISGIQKTQTTLDTLGRLWQSLNDQIASVPPKWKASAKASLDAGAALLAQGDPAAEHSLQAARQLISDGTRWASRAVECQTELAASQSCQTKDADAQQALSAAQTAVQQALGEQDLAGAAKSLDRLKSTVSQINQAYEVRIVCRTGHRSIIQRTEHNSRANRYYAIVESVNPDGTPVPRRIQSRESGTFLETAMWGQEIPQSLYQELYHEKSTTGAIQDLSFGAKQPGFLEPQFTKAPGSNHEITSW
jgi:hypothetical protein